ncbi:hypothetical protein KI387_043642, partial [Taxus chinensis]
MMFEGFPYNLVDFLQEEEGTSAPYVIENIEGWNEPGERPFVLDLPDDANKYSNTRFQYNEEAANNVFVLYQRWNNLFRSRTAPAMWNARKVQESLKRPELDSAASIVKQAFIYLIVYLSVGVVIYSLNKDKFSGNETNPIVDALYFCIVTMCTIGYGDITPMTTSTKLFSCFFVLVGFGFVDIFLGGMVTYVLDKQENLLLSTVEGSHHDIAKTYIVDVKKVMSVTTVGYGDHAFKTLPGRLFASVWLLVSTLAVARAFLYFAEARIDKRHRLIAKWVLHRDMTIDDLLAADIDNNGFV